ncbi:DNA polymerase III subunits gamma and tau [Enterobacter asburiae]|uniref:DNA-directed DNA polymerase n=1 Tax=Enterobacter asburiae TaxID=61645 RepID=A0A376F208_ENTAS|nr:DNA polymerase III subunits gamma and tau [Enterobacter asburiae]
MSYQVLARKWRPQTFADVVGQEHVLTALANGLSLGRIHHAYLFSGTRGVGKTSIARLLAKGLNCETGITATPCGVCDNCREIEQGAFCRSDRDRRRLAHQSGRYPRSAR